MKFSRRVYFVTLMCSYFATLLLFLASIDHNINASHLIFLRHFNVAIFLYREIRDINVSQKFHVITGYLRGEGGLEHF